MFGADTDFGPCGIDFSFSAYEIELHFRKLKFLYSLLKHNPLFIQSAPE